jgi:pimeloyl-ACP methyl ester carboxylesterase
LAEDIGADQFWVRPGIVAALEARGWMVVAPDRNTTPTSWSNAAAEIAQFVGEACTVVAASNGVSVALRMAIDQPGLVSRLVLLWPATAGDDVVDQMVPSTAAHLLAGDTVRGVSDAELGGIMMPVAVMATDVPNLFHQYRTVDRLVDLIPLAVRLDERFPESPRPDFIGRLDEFTAVLVDHL